MEMILMFIGCCYLALLIRMVINVVLTFTKPTVNLKNWPYIFLVISAALFLFIGPIVGYIRYDQYRPDIPYFKKYDTILVVLSVIGMAGFWISFLAKYSLKALATLLVTVAMWIGAAVCLVNCLHFIPKVMMGVLFPPLGFELLSPYLAFLLLLREIYQLKICKAEMKRIVPGSFWHKSFAEQFMYLFPLAAVTVLVVNMLFTLSGYPEDMLIRVFTQSKGFLFSN